MFTNKTTGHKVSLCDPSGTFGHFDATNKYQMISNRSIFTATGHIIGGNRTFLNETRLKYLVTLSKSVDLPKKVWLLAQFSPFSQYSTHAPDN